ncbi:MAG: DUF4760 domain-containing protein [Promethearchaeota archaeon]
MSKPTKEDASLLLQLLTFWASNEETNDAREWVFEKLIETNYDDFKVKYPVGSEGRRKFMRFASNGELVGLLVNRDLLSEDLVFDLYGSMLWEKIEPIAQGMRKDFNMPRLYENFEVCAKNYAEWEKRNPPKV